MAKDTATDPIDEKPKDAQDQDKLDKPTDDVETAQANEVRETVAPDAEDLPENKDNDDAKGSGLKTVNIPLSASNALQPEAGIQINVPEDSTEETLQTDAYDPQKTKVQATLKDGASTSDGEVSEAKYNQLKTAFLEMLDSQIIDATHRQFYIAKAGI